MLIEKLQSLQKEVKDVIISGKFKLTDARIHRSEHSIMLFGVIDVEGIHYSMILGEDDYLELRNTYDNTYLPLNLTDEDKSLISKHLWKISSVIIKETYNNDITKLQKVIDNIS